MSQRLAHRFLGSLAPTLLLLTLLAACGGGAATSPTSAPAATAAPEATAAPAATAVPEATAAPTATTAPEDQTDEQIKAGIQETLDKYAKAYNENDPELLKQTYDLTNPPFRRLIQGRFDTAQQSINAGRFNYQFGIESITKMDYGFVNAKVTYGSYVANWLFRFVDGRWVLSEPTNDQIGKKKQTETEHFTFVSYPWEDDITPKIMELMEQARETALEKLGKVPDEKATVILYPTFGVAPNSSSNTLAFYDRNNPHLGDRIIIYSPSSFIFGFYDEATGWESELSETLTHEYVHLVNNRSFTPISRMSDWMVEGVAEYISAPDNPLYRGVPLAVQSDQIIPIIDTSDRVNKQDLQHLTILDHDVSLAYGLSSTLVEYIHDTYGGMDGFWKLTSAYDTSQDLNKALEEAFGISYDQFDSDWRAWLKQRYS